MADKGRRKVSEAARRLPIGDIRADCSRLGASSNNHTAKHTTPTKSTRVHLVPGAPIKTMEVPSVSGSIVAEWFVGLAAGLAAGLAEFMIRSGSR
jgi:hypothetical protein